MFARIRQFTSVTIVFAICILGIGVNSAVGASAGSPRSTLNFPVRNDQPRGNGFAEIRFEAHRPNGKSASFHNLVWFQGRSRYRVQTRLRVGRSRALDEWNYFVNDGSHYYCGMGLGGQTHRVKWYGYPTDWVTKALDSGLDTYLQHPTTTINSPRLVGHDRMFGLRVEHWQGTCTTRYDHGTENVWVSTDARYPLVLRDDKRWDSGSWNSWRVTKLDLSHPIQGYLFTAQTHPRGGLLADRSITYKPTSLYLLWHLLILAVLVGAAFSAYWKPENLAAFPRIAGIAACLALLAGLGISDQTMYSLSYHDTPAAAAVLAMNGVFIFAMIRFLGMPNGVRFAKGTTWTSWLFILGAALLGVSAQYSRQQHLASSLGLPSWHLPFSPAVLLNVLLFSLGAAFASELVFRGYLYGILEKHLKSGVAVIGLQALVYGLSGLPALDYTHGLHAQMIGKLVGFCVAGIILGLLRRRYKNLLVPTLAAFASNASFFYIAAASTLGAVQALPNAFR